MKFKSIRIRRTAIKSDKKNPFTLFPLLRCTSRLESLSSMPLWMATKELYWHMGKLAQVRTVTWRSDRLKTVLRVCYRCMIHRFLNKCFIKKTFHLFEFSGKTFTLLSDDGVTTRVVQHCFEKIDNDEIHTYKVSMKLYSFHPSPISLFFFVYLYELNVVNVVELNFQRIGLAHQYGRRFFVLKLQHGGRDATWKLYSYLLSTLSEII